MYGTKRGRKWPLVEKERIMRKARKGRKSRK